ncbi:MAG: Efflux ABC transporter, ATP-binding protein [uncultured Rubrobacteraceae bacterium]|uniref:Efflux ABC transporter, ATP-binding protein n=1 Tax=uncultured Rubrobacteraceae bacterium TaxID=349277 RepID=A0A6J4QZF5_9ACTN|nr:MAG: Efflux ABC transporter, ATP-binding protein [uncultured Rubrobacteraceae bacterium]
MGVRREASVLEVRGFTKKFGDFVAVDSLSFEVRRGDVYGFLGPNGSGKSTTIRAIFGLVEPTEGEIRLLGHQAGRPGGREGVAGFVDMPGFYDYLSARDNLKVLAAADRRKGEAPMTRVLETVGLLGRERDKVKTYSTGMKQRLAIASALLREPEVLILDEPTNGLDPGGMRDVRDLIRRLNEDGLTIFLSSHLLAEVEQLCNRVAVIGHGRLLAEGTIAEVVGGDNGRPGYRLVVDDAKSALRILESTTNVTGASVAEPPDGLGDEEIRFAVGPEGPGPVVRDLVAGGVAVLALVPARPSLEDLFLELTEERS